MRFCEKIVRLRKIKGITQDELASAVGVSRQAVYKWECGQSYPEASKLIELKALFGISIDDLLDESYEIALPEKKRRRRMTKARAERLEAEVKAELAATGEPRLTVTEQAPAPEAADAVTVVEAEAVPAAPESGAETFAEDIVAEAERIVEAAEVAESVTVAVPAAEEAPEANAAAEEATAAASTPAPKAPAAEPVAEEKKRGFFSRLFGRK